MNSGELTNSLRIILFTLKRDKIWLTLWCVAIIATSSSFAPIFVEFAGNETEIAALAETMKNPVMIALSGPSYGDEYTYGIMFIQLMLVWMVVVSGLMNIFFIVRHTRKDEEDGKTEIIRSLPVGKVANLFSLYIVIFCVNILIAILSGLSLYALNIESMNFVGCMLFGFSFGAAGFFFAGLSGIMVQIFSSSRGASGCSIALLGFFFLVRAAGDIQNNTLALFTPFGLAGRTKIFFENDLWPLAIIFGITILLIVIAFALNNKRDFGAGLLPERGGRAHAKLSMCSPFGLAARLTRGSLIAWGIAILAIASSYGSVFGDLKGFYSNNELFKSMLGLGTSDSAIMNPLIAMLMLIMSMIAAVPVVAVVFRLGAEEKNGRLEQIYAKAVCKKLNIFCFFIIAVIAAIIFQLFNGVGMWASAYIEMDDPIGIIIFIKAAFNYGIGILFIAALAVFVIGVIPRAKGIIWIYLVYCFVIVYIGGILNLPEWVSKISAFSFLSRYPENEFELMPVIILIILAGVLTLVGITAYRKREI